MRMFAALLRVLSDRQVFEARNVSELCRRLSSIPVSDGTEKIGEKSFRNSFENPLPEILEKLLVEVKIWENYIIKFIERQRR